MIRALLAVLVLLAVACTASSPTTRLSPPDHPEIFAPGVVSTDATEISPSISPDLREFYFSRLEEGRLVLHVVEDHSGTWGSPRPVAFGSVFSEDQAFVTPDNRHVFYSSMRPLPGSTGASGNYDIWFADRTATGWGTPHHLDPWGSSPVDPSSLRPDLTENDFHPSVARTGNLYFAAARPGGRGSYDIYVMEETDAGYLPPRALPDNVNTSFSDTDPAIDPDERYLVFSSDRSPSGPEDYGDLFVSFRMDDGSWSDPVALGTEVNSTASERTPALSPDGNTLFFASKRSGVFNIYWVRLAFAR